MKKEKGERGRGGEIKRPGESVCVGVRVHARVRVCRAAQSHTCMHHAASASKSCNGRGAKMEKAALLAIPCGPAGEAEERNQGRRGSRFCLHTLTNSP